MNQPFQRMVIYCRIEHEQAMDLIAQCITIAEACQRPCLLLDKSLKCYQAQYQHALTMVASAALQAGDLVVVIGGDGSILHAARHIDGSDAALIGINLGKVGFLSDIAPSALSDDLKAVVQGEYVITSQQQLAGSVAEQQAIAVNEILVTRSETAKLMHVDVYVDHHFICQYAADGVIISSAIGSTGYALSAGGPIIPPQCPVVGITPICPHRLNSRPLVVPKEAVITLQVRSGNVTPQLCFDGLEHHAFTLEDTVEITEHKHRLPMVHPLHYNYFSVLQEKLMWEKNQYARPS